MILEGTILKSETQTTFKQKEKLTVELICITCEYRSTVMSFSTFTEPPSDTYIINLSELRVDMQI